MRHRREGEPSEVAAKPWPSWIRSSYSRPHPKSHKVEMIPIKLAEGERACRYTRPLFPIEAMPLQFLQHRHEHSPPASTANAPAKMDDEHRTHTHKYIRTSLHLPT